MIFLANLLSPDPGLFVWTVVVFLILWFLLGKFAFKPISKALRTREDSIKTALESAEKAKQEMAALNSDNEALLRKAKEERATILKEAKAVKEQIIAEAKDEAKAEAAKILNDTKSEIENQKMAAITDVKNRMGNISLEIAEKVLKRELKDKADQEKYANSLVEEINI